MEEEEITKNNEVSLLRAIFRSEITWVISIVAVVWAFVATVVLPINNLQIQVAQVQSQLAGEQTKYDQLNQNIQDVNSIANKALTEIESHINSK